MIAVVVNKEWTVCNCSTVQRGPWVIEKEKVSVIRCSMFCIIHLGPRVNRHGFPDLTPRVDVVWEIMLGDGLDVGNVEFRIRTPTRDFGREAEGLHRVKMERGPFANIELDPVNFLDYNRIQFVLSHDISEERNPCISIIC